MACALSRPVCTQYSRGGAGDDVDDERTQDGNGVVKSPGEGGRTQ